MFFNVICHFIDGMTEMDLIYDAGELEADWLSEVGLGEWTQQWRSGKSLPENDIGPAVQKLSLKPHQVRNCCE